MQQPISPLDRALRVIEHQRAVIAGLEAANAALVDKVAELTVHAEERNSLVVETARLCVAEVVADHEAALVALTEGVLAECAGDLAAEALDCLEPCRFDWCCGEDGSDANGC